MDNSEAKTFKLPRNVILVDSSAVSRKLFAQNIELYTGATVHFMANADEVIDKITNKEEGNHYDLIITDPMVGDENTVLKVYYAVNSQKLDIPIIVLGKSPKVSDGVEEIEKENWRKVIKKAASLMEVNAEKMMETEVPNLYPFPLYTILYNFASPMPLYKEKIGEFEMWKKTGDSITKDEVRDLIFSGEKSIYVTKMLRLEFVEFLTGHTLTALKANDLSLKERLNATGRVFDLTMDRLKTNGFDEKVISITKDLVESVVTDASGDPGLEDFLTAIQESEESFLYKHSLLMCTLAKGCLKHLEWGNKNQEKVLIYAAFFHDMALLDDDLCVIQYHEDLKEKNLGVEKLDKVDKHALKASELIQSYSQVPMGVSEVILQHHGSLNGLGLPSKEKALDNRLSPLAIVFIVIENFASLLLEKETKPLELLVGLEKKFAKGKELKVVEALKKLFA